MRIPDLDSGNPVSFSNANGISFGTSGDVVTVAAAGSIVAGTQTGWGAAQTITFSNSNNVTWQNNAQSVGISYSQSTSPQAIAAGTQTATTGTIIFSNSNGITFGMNGSTITASAAGPKLIFWENLGAGNIGNVATTNGSLLVGRMCTAPFPGVMTVSTALISFFVNATQSTAAGSLNVSLGIYTLNGSTLSLLNSASTQVTWAAVSNNSTAFSGNRCLSIHSSQWSSSPSFSQTDYWCGLVLRSSGATQSLNPVCNIWSGDQAFGSRLGTVGVNAAASNATFLDDPFHGYYSVSTAALPTSIGSAEINAVSAPGPVNPLLFFNNFNASF